MIETLKETPRFLRYVFDQYGQDKCAQSAGALTYMSLFAVVPLMTVTYAILSAVPAFQSLGDQVQNFIFNHFVPSTGTEVQQYLAQFSQQARKLTYIGVIILVTSAYFMLRNIEKTFNEIWNTRQNRRGLASFLLYWAVLSLGPVFIGLGLIISTYLISLSVFVTEVDVLGLWNVLLRLMPTLLTALTFTLLFAAVPNCKVPFKHAFIGGLITALCFEASKSAFALIMSNFSYELIYGTFAAIPLFLIWVYFSWLLVLAGAELVKSLSSYQSQRTKRFDDFTVCIAILEYLWSIHQQAGTLTNKNILNKKWLFNRYNIGQQQWEKLRNLLLDHHVIRTTEDGYLLGKDLHKLTLWELYLLLTNYKKRSVPNLQGNAENVERPPWSENLDRLLNQLDDTNQNTMALTVAELLNDT